MRAPLEEAVKDHLAMCEKIGRPPLRSASGKMMLRVPEEVHAAALRAAEASGKSLNQWAAEVLAQEHTDD